MLIYESAVQCLSYDFGNIGNIGLERASLSSVGLGHRHDRRAQQNTVVAVFRYFPAITFGADTHKVFDAGVRG